MLTVSIFLNSYPKGNRKIDSTMGSIAMRKTVIAALSVAGIFAGAFAGADGHASEEQLKAAMEARQAHMKLYAFHLGTLGGMAKGEVDYDAASAQAAADSIAALSGPLTARRWLPGRRWRRLQSRCRLLLELIWPRCKVRWVRLAALAADATNLIASPTTRVTKNRACAC